MRKLSFVFRFETESKLLKGTYLKLPLSGVNAWLKGYYENRECEKGRKWSFSGAKLRKICLSERRINEFIMPNVKILFNKLAEKQIKLVLFCFFERK